MDDQRSKNQTDTTSDDEITIINVVDNVSFLIQNVRKVKIKRKMSLRSRHILFTF